MYAVSLIPAAHRDKLYLIAKIDKETARRERLPEGPMLFPEQMDELTPRHVSGNKSFY